MTAAALKVVHLVDEGAYLVDRGYGVELEVDGLPAPSQFVVQSLDSVVMITRTHGAITHYRSKEGEQIDAEAYGKELAALVDGSTIDDEGEREFDDLDAEFAWRKFVAKWCERVYSPAAVTRSTPEFSIVEVRVRSGDPDIVSLWNAPSAADARLYTVDRDVLLMRTAIAACAAEGLSFRNETFGYLQFAKIEGAYAFDKSFSQSRPFVGTLEQCIAEKSACIARVTRVVQLQAAKKRGVTLRNTAHVIASLEDVVEMLTVVTTTSKSANGMAKAKAKLREIVHGLRGEISAT